MRYFLGKTLLARAIAQAISTKDKSHKQDVGGAFISLKASGIVRPEIGNSEKLIVAAFESARVNAPSVVFIDEFQVILNLIDFMYCVISSCANI
jgi:SpoVK/Ycf46/Vps4 family AAA+-type ATPase